MMMPEFIRFTIYGRAQPQGSARLVPVKGYDRPFITSDNPKLKSFRQEASSAADAAMNKARLVMLPRMTPVQLTATFYLARPSSLAKKYEHHTKKPDLDKFLRATGDAITGIIMEDDSQVWRAVVEKLYGLPERVEVIVDI